jgi:hypothetical protein
VGGKNGFQTRFWGDGGGSTGDVCIEGGSSRFFRAVSSINSRFEQPNSVKEGIYGLVNWLAAVRGCLGVRYYKFIVPFPYGH